MILQPQQILFINSWRTHRCGLNALVVSYRNFVCGSWWALMSQLIVVKSPLRLFSHITEWMRPVDTHLAADNSSYANRAAAAGGWKEGWMWKNSVILSLKYIFRLIPIPPTHTRQMWRIPIIFCTGCVWICVFATGPRCQKTNKQVDGAAAEFRLWK